MFGTSGVRGTVGEALTAETALDVGRAVASRGAETVVVGRDARDSGRVLADAASAGARECGADVVRVGVATTPAVARSVGWLDADAGVMVTGSHNPPSDNGLKLWTPSGRAFDREQRREVTRIVEDDAFTFADATEHGGERTWNRASERHRERLRSTHRTVDDLAVVVDVGNGTGRVTADALTEMGCAVQTLNGQRDGTFPGRESEPTAETCETLARVVESTGADLGVAHDGDADRMMAVDDTGRFLDGDELLALFARDAVEAGDEVAVPVNTSLLVDDVVSDAGGSVSRTSVGDAFVAEHADRPGVVFGGEPSGAWIWPDETLCPDGPFAACRLVTSVDRRGPLSEQVAAFEPYPLRRESVEVANKRAAMDRLREQLSDRYDEVDDTDGVRVDLGDAWFLVRASGTEPLIRVTVEARSAERAATVFDDLFDVVTAKAVHG